MYWKVLMVFGSRGLRVPEGVIDVVVLLVEDAMVDEDETTLEVLLDWETVETVLDVVDTAVLVLEVSFEDDEVEEDDDDDDAEP